MQKSELVKVNMTQKKGVLLEKSLAICLIFLTLSST